MVSWRPVRFALLIKQQARLGLAARRAGEFLHCLLLPLDRLGELACFRERRGIRVHEEGVPAACELDRGAGVLHRAAAVAQAFSRRGGEEPGELVVRRRELGRDADGLAEIADRAIGLAQSRISAPALEVSRDEARIEPDRLAEVLDRALVMLQA